METSNVIETAISELAKLKAILFSDPRNEEKDIDKIFSAEDLILIIEKMCHILEVLISNNYIEECEKIILVEVEGNLTSEKMFARFASVRFLKSLYKIERLTIVTPEMSLQLLKIINKNVLIRVFEKIELKDSFDIEFAFHLNEVLFGNSSPQFHNIVIKLFNKIKIDKYTKEYANTITKSLFNRKTYDIKNIDRIINVINSVYITNADHFFEDDEIICKLVELIKLFTVETADSNTVLAKLYFTIGSLYIRLLDENTGAIYYHKCLELRRKIYGNNSNEYARTLTMIAFTIKNLETKESMLKEAYEIRSNTLGEGSSSALNAAYYLTDVYSQIGKKSEAIYVLEHILSLEKNDDYKYYIQSEMKLAYLYSETLSSKALTAWDCLREKTKDNDRKRYFESSIGYANELRRHGDYPRSINILYQIKGDIANSDTLKEEFYATVVNDIGLNMQSLFGKKNKKALEHLIEATDIRIEKENTESILYWRATITKITLESLLNENTEKEIERLKAALVSMSANQKLKNSEDFLALQFLISDCLIHSDKFNDALLFLDNFYFQPNISSIERDNYYLCSYARIYYLTGQDKKALQIFQKVIKQCDIGTWMYFNAGHYILKIFLEQKDKDNCIKTAYELFCASKTELNKMVLLKEFKSDIDVFIKNLRKFSNAYIMLSVFFGENYYNTESLYDAILFNKYLLFSFDSISESRLSKLFSERVETLQQKKQILEEKCLKIELLNPLNHELTVAKNKIVEIEAELHNPEKIYYDLIGKREKVLLTTERILLECYCIRLENSELSFRVIDGNSIESINDASSIDSNEVYVFFLIKSNSQIISYSVSKNKIDEIVRNLREAIEINSPNECILSKELYSLIFSKIENHLQNYKHILIAPDGLLFQIPFEILMDSNSEYLVDRFLVSYINAGSQLNDMKLKRVEITKSLVMGNPQFFLADDNRSQIANDLEPLRTLLRNGFIPQLPYTEHEIKQISRLLKTRYYNLKHANKNNFFKNADANIIHIATHGFDLSETQDDQLPIAFKEFEDTTLFRKSLHLTGLLLSGATNTINSGYDTDDNGILTADEISRMDLSKTDLVVLSACETGKGYYLYDEGIWGLRRSFELAGVHSTINSLWQVNDLSTYILMTKFYESLIGGKSRLESLKLAQRYVRNVTVEDIEVWLKSDMRLSLSTENIYNTRTKFNNKTKFFSSTKYWAGFVIFGDWT